MEPVKPAKNNLYGVTSLDESMLSSIVPTRTFGGGALIGDAAECLFIFRTTALNKPRGGTLGFFVDDSRLEPLWARPERYGVEFSRAGIAAVVEPDFSLWADDPIDKQLQAVKQKKIVARVWQEYDLRIVPNLNWAGEASFAFCFAGIPIGCPVAFTECRTASSSIQDRRAFLCGLHEAVRVVQPATLVIYGGVPNRWWIERDLPQGETRFVFLESWADSRGRIRKAERRQLREQNQPNLFTGGNEQWADEAVVAAA